MTTNFHLPRSIKKSSPKSARTTPRQAASVGLYIARAKLSRPRSSSNRRPHISSNTFSNFWYTVVLQDPETWSLTVLSLGTSSSQERLLSSLRLISGTLSSWRLDSELLKLRSRVATGNATLLELFNINFNNEG